MATRGEPYLRLLSNGPLGNSSVDFSKGRDLLETFSVRERWAQSFKFDMIKSASEAMRIASKVSLRGDRQGVLSLQFMVEIEDRNVQWLHFTFVPYVTIDDDGNDEHEEDGGNGGGVQDNEWKVHEVTLAHEIRLVLLSSHHKRLSGTGRPTSSIRPPQVATCHAVGLQRLVINVVPVPPR